MDRAAWISYVDHILSTMDNNKLGGDEQINALRTWDKAEYEQGIEPEVFRKLLENLKKGDLVIFHFKSYSLWAMNFQALFGRGMQCFKYDSDQLMSFENINIMALTGGRYTGDYKIKCKIIDSPISKSHDVDWMVKYLGICLKDFSVLKPV